jgi:NAD(P)-dependent dehydrogenase (short-subunit alcohol dehydrogenase family)
MKLNNKKILLIGGSHGMGLGTARAVLAQGAQVILVGREMAKLEASRNELVGNVRIVQGDITEIDLHETLLESIGRFDHVFISASPGGDAGFNDPHLAIEDSYIYGKVWCTFKFLQKAVHYIHERGSITLMSGGYAIRSTPDYPLVSMAFAATEAMARALAVSIAPIRVNAIRPTHIDQKKPATSKTLTGTMGSTDDIGDAVAFLMGNDYMTGEALNIDGGAGVIFT